MSFTAKKQCTIHVPVEKAWEGLTDAKLVAQYFFGTQLATTWEVGTPIEFTGEWDGTAYRDHGTVLKYHQNHYLQYDYLSSWSNLADQPENYQMITYRVRSKGDHTIVTVTQALIPTLEQKVHSAQNWGMLLKAMKELLEK